jgi:putative FmdB family regulatory protein
MPQHPWRKGGIVHFTCHGIILLILFPSRIDKGEIMPIYEFYCEGCNTIFNFYSKSINTTKQPNCPRCRKETLKRFLSTFSVLREGSKGESEEPLPVDEEKMEKAIGALAREADTIDEDDPRQAANVMRRLSEMAGLPLGKGMKEAIERIEGGEDPDKIEEEMGDILEEDPFTMPEKRMLRGRAAVPSKDETLYELDDY